MKKKFLNPFLLGAIALGVISVFLVMKYLDAHTADLKRANDERIAALRREFEDKLKSGGNVVLDKKPERPVVYAKQPIAANQRIEAVLVEIKQTPKELIANGLQSVEEVAGKFASKPIEIGEPLTTGNVTAEAQTMSQRLTPGLRAVSLPVLSQANVSGGFIASGDRVDLLFTYPEPGVPGLRTVTALQNVRVLWVPGSPVETKQTAGLAPAQAQISSGGVTFEVTPSEAEILTNMTTIRGGVFSVVLRSKTDESMVRTPGQRQSEFLENPGAVQRKSDRSQAQTREFLKQLEERRAQAQAQEAAASSTNAAPAVEAAAPTAPASAPTGESPQ